MVRSQSVQIGAGLELCPKRRSQSLCSAIAWQGAGKEQMFTFDESFWSHDGYADDGTGYLRLGEGPRDGTSSASVALRALSPERPKRGSQYAAAALARRHKTRLPLACCLARGPEVCF